MLVFFDSTLNKYETINKEEIKIIAMYVDIFCGGLDKRDI